MHKTCDTDLDVYRSVCEEDKGHICNVRLKFKENAGNTGLGIQAFDFESYQCVMSECDNVHDLKTMEWQQKYIYEAVFGPEDNAVEMYLACNKPSAPAKPPTSPKKKAKSALGRKVLVFFIILLLVIGFIAAVFHIWKRNTIISQEADSTSLLAPGATAQEEGKNYRIYTRLDG